MAAVSRATAVDDPPARRGRHARISFWSRYGTDVGVAVGLAIVAVTRIVLLAVRGEPTGVDVGNWLMLGHALFGSDLPGAATVVYPPLVPALATGMTAAFGVTTGSAILLGTAGIAPAVGLYVAARWNDVRTAAVPAILLAATSSTGEAVAWGGAPQLIGFGFGAAAIGGANRLLTRRNPVTAAWLSLCIFGVAATSHLVLAQTGLVLALLVVVGGLFGPGGWRGTFGPGTWWGTRGWFACLAVVVVPLVVFVPLYLHLLTTVGQSFAGGTGTRPAAGWDTFWSFLQNLVVVYRDSPWFWRPAMLITALFPFVLLRTRVRAHALWAPTVSLVVAALVQACVSDQDRLVFVVPIVTAFGLTLILDELLAGVGAGIAARRLQMLGCTVLVVAMAVASIDGLRYFRTERDFYARLSPPGSITDLDWLRGHTSASAVTLVAPINGAPFGWWVQGYGRRSAYVASEDRWLNFPDERRRARAAVQVLSTDDVFSPSVKRRLDRLGVDYLVLPWAWGGVRRADVRALERSRPGAVAYDGRAMVVVDVTALAGNGPATGRGDDR